MKTKLLFITLTFIGWSNFTNAQTPNWEWAKDTSTIALGGMTTDVSGNLFVSNGFGEGFLVKYDNDGVSSLSSATVRKHTENIYKKLSVHNKVEAIHKCIEKKILKF